MVQCIKDQNGEKKSEVENFIKIIQEVYSTTINKSVIESQQEYIRSKKPKLPTSKDIELLTNHLETEREKHYKELKREFRYNHWLQLSKCCFIYIQMFNRRRAGETERMLISDLMKHHTINEKADADILSDIYQ